jgi:drug/metabolite transporter (DMT)-like permease
MNVIRIDIILLPGRMSNLLMQEAALRRTAGRRFEMSVAAIGQRAPCCAARSAPAISPRALGSAAGLLAALIWGGYMAMSRAGVSEGLRPEDFALLRFGTAGTLLLPVLLARGGLATLGGVGWRRGMLLTLCAGPLLIMAIAGGYMYAPLAHGAVIQPSTITLATLLLAALVLRERPSLSRAIATGVIIAGIALVAGTGLVGGGGGEWRGDLLFVSAGAAWAVFTVLVKRWKVDPMAGTAAVCVLSALFVIPGYLLWATPDRLVAIGFEALASQIVVQGVLAGALAVIAYGKAVASLGAGRAAIFPALVPAFSLIIGVPVTGEVPTAPQLVGITIVSIGLVLALDLVGVRRSRAPAARLCPEGVAR